MIINVCVLCLFVCLIYIGIQGYFRSQSCPHSLIVCEWKEVLTKEEGKAKCKTELNIVIGLGPILVSREGPMPRRFNDYMYVCEWMIVCICLYSCICVYKCSIIHVHFYYCTHMYGKLYMYMILWMYERLIVWPYLCVQMNDYINH